MKNHSLKIVAKRNKRLGRGYGSGKGGHTVGKGQKGQKTRKKLGILFEGVKVRKSLIKRLPFLRGKRKFVGKIRPLPIDLKRLESLPSGTKVDVKTLVKHGVVGQKDILRRGVKILGNSEVSKKLNILLPISKSASEKIIKAGGTVSKYS
jgi:large subunit ribosomal protein L15